MLKYAFFDTKPYDVQGFEKCAKENGIEFKFFETKLDESTVALAQGCDGVVVFVNDTVNENVINKLYEQGVKLIALRCAGFNNVDTRAAFGKIHVVRVPAYSPYAVAEHAMALLLCSIRRIHKAYNRTREFNFSLSGFTGFDLHGKTVGVIGTGKIGKAFINICLGFGMRVLAYDKYPCPELASREGVSYASTDEIFIIEDGKLRQCGVGKGILDYDKILSKIYSSNPDAILVLEGTVGEDIDFAVSYLRKKINKLT